MSVCISVYLCVSAHVPDSKCVHVCTPLHVCIYAYTINKKSSIAKLSHKVVKNVSQKISWQNTQNIAIDNYVNQT